MFLDYILFTSQIYHCKLGSTGAPKANSKNFNLYAASKSIDGGRTRKEDSSSSSCEVVWRKKKRLN